MTWTYDTALTTTKDQIRLETADTDTTAQLLQDEEIVYLMGLEQNFWGASARCCEVISRNFLRKADVRLGRSLMLAYSVMAKQYGDMATAFRKRANATNAPWTGGTSLSDKTTLAQDTSLVQPLFTKHMEDNPYVGGQGTDTPTNDGQ